MRTFVVVVLSLLSLATSSVYADYGFELKGETTAGFGSHDFAPFYIASNRHGVLTQANNILIDIAAFDTLDNSRRFDVAWGVEAWAGSSNSVVYGTYHLPERQLVYDNPQRPSNIWLQQLFAEVKYRRFALSVGMKNHGSLMLDPNLSSGDVVWSGNSRGIPEIRAGLTDFTDLPFCNGWVQVNAAIAYGKFTDKDWVWHHTSLQKSRINPTSLWNYKYLLFQTKPSKPFSFLFGLQSTVLFGGTLYAYTNGELILEQKNKVNLYTFLKTIVPTAGDTEGNYVPGDHKGAWTGALRYRFSNGATLRGYFEWFFEDGSGLVKNNGWDGLWGLEYKSHRPGFITGAVMEYLDFRHQSGPINFDPNDRPGTSITTQTRGRDDYYNSWYYRSYCNYGMTIGTPLVMGIIYNTDGSSSIYASAVRAFHLALEGNITPNLGYLLKFNHRKAWGPSNSFAILSPLHANSYFVGLHYRVPFVRGLNVKFELGIDRGTAPSNASGALLSLSYLLPVKFKNKNSL